MFVRLAAVTDVLHDVTGMGYPRLASGVGRYLSLWVVMATVPSEANDAHGCARDRAP